MVNEKNQIRNIISPKVSDGTSGEWNSRNKMLFKITPG
jgi:hypothetical protein